MRNKNIKSFILIPLVVFNLIPFIWLCIGSFLPNTYSDRGISIPTFDRLTFNNYFELSNNLSFFIYLKNTIIVSFFSSFFVTSASTLSAYGLTRFFKRYISISEIFVIFGYLLSPIILVFPYAVILKYLGLMGSLFGLILANTAFCFPFSFFLMLRYMQNISEKYDQSASMDGATWWQTLIYIILPRALPGVVAVSIFSFILAWNDVALSKILANQDTMTLAAGVKEKILDIEQTQYGLFAAASILVTLIAILVFGFMQFWIDERLKKESSSHI